MNDFQKWAVSYPKAAVALGAVLSPAPLDEPPVSPQTEQSVQQLVRFKIARMGAKSWRNNVGATPSRCAQCGVKTTPIRYGLANDSRQVNEQIKSSDLILAIPRLVEPHMVGQTIAQFGAVECKRQGWEYSGTGREGGQAAWLALIHAMGGYAAFSTGKIEL